MVLANFGVWCGVILGIGIKRIFFGRLRGVEYEVSQGRLRAEREECVVEWSEKSVVELDECEMERSGTSVSVR